MTKDWDAVQNEITELSWVQKKRLDEVKKIMENRHGFKASTRVYRMKLAAWGITRKAPRKATKDRSGEKRGKQQTEEEEQDEDEDVEGDESDSTTRGTPRDQGHERATRRGHELMHRDPENLETMLLGRAAIPNSSTDAVTFDPSLNLLQQETYISSTTVPVDSNPQSLVPWAQGGALATGIVMSMLGAILEGDSQKLDLLIMKHPNHINLPVGLPFEAHGGKFFNDPAINQCVILQHPNQTLFDIACGLPSGPVIWVLLAHGAKGSIHPLGTDLAFHNAIKNGRTYTVQALLVPGRSKIEGEPGNDWKPLFQGVYWNHPDVVRLIVDKGARINDTAPWVDGVLKSALQHCLDRRLRDYLNVPVREKCEKILKMLLNAGADIHLRPAGGVAPVPTPFETFLEPWRGDSQWTSKLNPIEIECLEAFVRKGADLKQTFDGFICGAPSGSTFEHQVLWHATSTAARLLIDNAAPNPDGNGNNLLHEIVGSCPDAKRHPSDTLRDIEVLLRRGADPNYNDGSSFTPLRRCIERCPAVDIVPRLQMLLDSGADPELKHSNELPPYVLAARNFDEPLRSQLMDFLVAKIRGRQPRVVNDDTFMWADDYFPIPDAPTFAQTQWYDGTNGDFNANLANMVPEDVRKPFQRAAFGVVSMNFLNAATIRAKMAQPLQLLHGEKDEIYQIVVQRQIARLPEYRFDQEFVMNLLKPRMAPVLANFCLEPVSFSTQQDEIMLPHQTPIMSMAPTEPNIIASGPHIAPAVPSRRSSISSNGSTSSLIATTTLIRWSTMGEPTRHGDIKKAKSAVLQYKCKECGDGNLLTKGELEKHELEHEHSRWCVEDRCRRRFCVGRM